MKPPNRYHLKVLLITILLLTMSSCAGFLRNALIGPALENMQQQEDLELFCEGTPAYLLMIDSLIAGDPKDARMLTLGAKAYGAAVGAMEECGVHQDRINALADKAYQYATRLLSLKLPISPSDSLDDLDSSLKHIGKDDSAMIFTGTFAWIVWIQKQGGAPGAMADLGKIEKILLRIIEVDETVQSGAAHFLLAGYYGSRPAMFGGDPVKSKFHFERALEISQRKMLIFLTTYAETLARLTMDKKLHDSLLDEVISFRLESNRETMLANQIAKRRATKLLQENYFSDQ